MFGKIAASNRASSAFMCSLAGAAAIAGCILIVMAPGFPQSLTPAASSMPTAAQAQNELERAGVIRGRPGGKLATQAAITKDELAQIVSNLVYRIHTLHPAAPTPAPSATRAPAPFAWLQRRLPSAQTAAALVGLHGWSNPQSTISRQEALAFELRIWLAQARPHEGNPRARIPLLADDADINPAYKPVIYLGLVQNLVAVDRQNRLRPKDPELRTDVFFTGYQVLRSAGARR